MHVLCEVEQHRLSSLPEATEEDAETILTDVCIMILDADLKRLLGISTKVLKIHGFTRTVNRCCMK